MFIVKVSQSGAVRLLLHRNIRPIWQIFRHTIEISVLRCFKAVSGCFPECIGRQGGPIFVASPIRLAVPGNRIDFVQIISEKRLQVIFCFQNGLQQRLIVNFLLIGFTGSGRLALSASVILRYLFHFTIQIPCNGELADRIRALCILPGRFRCIHPVLRL